MIDSPSGVPKADKTEQIKSIIKRYTHDKSKSGYDDTFAVGMCPDVCYQCKRDERFIEILLQKLEEQKQEIVSIISEYNLHYGDKVALIELVKNI